MHLLAKEDVLLLLYLDYRLRLTAPLKPELLGAPAYRGMEQGIEEEIGGPTLPGKSTDMNRRTNIGSTTIATYQYIIILFFT